jgi:dynein heavy chain
VIINQNREVYRPVAAEGAMLYFLIIKLYIVDPMYMYSLESFSIFFYKAIAKAAACEDDGERVESLVGTIRMTIYQWIARGLFQRHK